MKAIINTPYNIFDYTINESDTDYIVTIFSDFDFNKNIPKFTISSSNQFSGSFNSFVKDEQNLDDLLRSQ